MLVTKEIAKIQDFRWKDPAKSWGFVPTMGMLHEGHLSLVKRAIQENDASMVSIFVNPIQFNNSGDFDNYPTDLERDLSLLRELGVDAVFTPDKPVMYPEGYCANVSLKGIAEKLEGAARPGHFDGVTTVVSKLFNITQPTKTYFGQKDAQQLLIIQKMVKDLNFNLEVIPCPTSREKDGLAMSSRNVRLDPKQREKSVVIYRSLQKAESMIEEGERSSKKIIDTMQAMIQQEPLANIDYIAINDAETLDDKEVIQGRVLISLAVFFGEVRLIDNTIVTV